jgi:hypothetical protein
MPLNSFDPMGESPVGPTTYQMPANVQQTPPPGASITLVDLQNLLASLELAVERGAFKAPELSTLGATYDKVATFIHEIVKTAPVQSVPPTQHQQHNAPEPVTPMTPPFAPKGV